MIAIVHSIYSQSVHAPASHARLMDNEAERYCISCKNLNKISKKMSQKPISCKPFLDLATLHIPYVTNTPANRCHGKANYVFKHHLQSL